MDIPFSPPYIGDEEIKEVVDTLRSGWITTGPKTKRFEKEISKYCHTDHTVCLNSATAALELTLRVLGIGEGDEVITSAYTYTASASVICHVGATPVLVDVEKDGYNIDCEALKNAITPKTKAIIPVDIGGVPCDFNNIKEIVANKAKIFQGNSPLQTALGRIAIISDAAHSLGSLYTGTPACTFADFTCFSFHAVKNLTTAEGRAVTLCDINGVDSDDLYKQYQLLSLHGQSKDAFSKMQKGSWEYDIVAPYFKCNMTDIMAAIGLAQLDKYDDIVSRHFNRAKIYNAAFKNLDVKLPDIENANMKSNCHLYMLGLKKNDESYRNEIISKMAEKGISCNVHFKPLPLHTAYKSLGFDIKDYPNAYNSYINEISLPIYTSMTDEEQQYVIKSFIEIMGEM